MKVTGPGHRPVMVIRDCARVVRGATMWRVPSSVVAKTVTKGAGDVAGAV